MKSHAPCENASIAIKAFRTGANSLTICTRIIKLSWTICKNIRVSCATRFSMFNACWKITNGLTPDLGSLVVNIVRSPLITRRIWTNILIRSIPEKLETGMIHRQIEFYLDFQCNTCFVIFSIGLVFDRFSQTNQFSSFSLVFRDWKLNEKRFLPTNLYSLLIPNFNY
jgi:hypothetical protein